MNLDPTGISAIVVTKLVDLGLDELKDIYQCQDKCGALEDFLTNIRPMVSKATGTAVAGLGPVKKWLDNLERVLHKAESAVSKCKQIGRWKVLTLRQMSKRISKITEEIKDIFVNQASVPLLAVGVQTSRKADEIKKGLDEVRNELQMNSRNVRAEAQEILDNFRQLPDKIFGTDVPLTNLQNLLLGEIENKWVGVCGRGGIGKTLLAEQGFNTKYVRAHFQNRFWLTVGQNPSIGPLLQNLAGQMHLKTENRETAEVKTQLFNALQGRRVLLLLDDVWDDGVTLLDSLDVTSGTGSKILVTTRNVKVLKQKHVLAESVVRMECLTEDDSWQLFCEHAFRGVDNIPRQLDKTVMKAVVDECKGLPLALKVTAGALAHEESPELWQRALKRLKEAQPLGQGHEVELYGTLQLSYDSLESADHRLQKCFIYFAAFPEDYDVDSEKLANLWAGEKLLEVGDDIDDDFDPVVECFYLLNELFERSLVDLRKEWSDQVDPLHLRCNVHDVLRDFARHLITQKRAPMDCLFSAGKKLTKFPNNWLRDPTSDVTHLSLYNNPLESLPNELKAPKLEVLLLTNDHWLGSRRPLVISPGFLASFSSLKVLDLEYTQIDSLPESLGNLTNLIYLELSYTRLHKLPQRLQELTKLENLGLRGLTDVEPWPFDVSRLTSLSTLHTEDCEDIWKPIPEHRFSGREICDSLDSLCSITTLRNVSISSNHHEYLPSQMSSLVNLRHLRISCPRLKTLPPELQQLSKLQYFSLQGCQSLSELPSWMDSLSQLGNLSLQFCLELSSLPNLHKLQKLWKLTVSHCESLHQLPLGFTKTGAFPALKELNMSYCRGLVMFPSIEEGAFPHLIKLSMYNCSSLQQLPTRLMRRGAFPALKELNLSFCRALREFPPIEEGAFPQLITLYMSHCLSLQHLPTGFTRSGTFPALKELDMSSSVGLCTFPHIEEGAFPQLMKLTMTGCESLHKLPVDFTSKGAFPALKVLNMAHCTGLLEFPPMEEGGVPQLMKLYIDQCSSLKQLPIGFTRRGAFPVLEELDMSNCTGLRKLPNIEEGAFPQLVKLNMCHCKGLQQIPTGFTRRGAFPNLKKLDMSYCIGLHEFPAIEEGAFPELRILDLGGCGFENLPSSLRLLPKLETLDLSNCEQLENLDDCFNLHGIECRDPTSQVHHTRPCFASLQELRLRDVPLENLPCDLNEACPVLKTINLRPSSIGADTHVNIPENLQSLQGGTKPTKLRNRCPRRRQTNLLDK